MIRGHAQFRATYSLVASRTIRAAPSANRKSAPHGGALMPVGWAENGALVNARATFRVGRRAGTKKWAYPKVGPKNHSFLSDALCLRCWFRLWLGGRLGENCEG